MNFQPQRGFMFQPRCGSGETELRISNFQRNLARQCRPIDNQDATCRGFRRLLLMAGRIHVNQIVGARGAGIRYTRDWRVGVARYFCFEKLCEFSRGPHTGYLSVVGIEIGAWKG